MDTNDDVADAYTMYRREAKRLTDGIHGAKTTHEENASLARQMANHPPGSPPYMRARARFIEANLGLVMNTAAKKFARVGVAIEELVAEGNIGLMRAVEKFNPDKGWAFSTYADYWIRQAMLKCIPLQLRSIYVPTHVAEALHAFSKRIRALEQELGRMPTAQECAEDLGVDAEDAAEMLLLLQPVLSLDEPLSGAGSSGSASAHIAASGADGEVVTLADTLAQPEPPTPGPSTHDIESALRLADLTPREKQVVRLRFGLIDGVQRTLEETGREFGLTRERIRQIETKIWALLHTPAVVEAIRTQLTRNGVELFAALDPPV